MKKISISVTFLVTLLFSCNSQNSAKDTTATSLMDTLTYKTIRIDSSYRTANASLNYLVVSGGSPELNQRVNDSLMAFMGGKNPTDILANGVLKEWKTYLEEEKIAVGKEADASISGVGYYENDTLYVMYNSPTIFSVTSNYDNYMGGAHGMYGTSYRNFALPAVKGLALKDLFLPNTEAELLKIGEAEFRKVNNLGDKSLEEEYMFPDNKFILNENFCITKKGLLFTYNPYEIASYAQGAIDLLIPYSSLKPIINKEGALGDFIK